MNAFLTGFSFYQIYLINQIKKVYLFINKLINIYSKRLILLCIIMSYLSNLFDKSNKKDPTTALIYLIYQINLIRQAFFKIRRS